MRFDFFVLSLHFFRHTIDTKPSESWCLHSLWEGTQRFASVTRFSSSSNRHKNEKWRRDISGPLLTALGDSLSSGALFAFPENDKLSLATATLCGYLSSVTVRSFFNDLNFLFVQQNRTGSVWSFAMNHNKRPDSFFGLFGSSDKTLHFQLGTAGGQLARGMCGLISHTTLLLLLQGLIRQGPTIAEQLRRWPRCHAAALLEAYVCGASDRAIVNIHINRLKILCRTYLPTVVGLLN